MRLLALAALVAGLALLPALSEAALPPGSPAGPRVLFGTNQTTYVSGSLVRTPFGPFGLIVCQGGHGQPYAPVPVGLGGACDLAMPSWPNASIVVNDQVLGQQVVFLYMGIDDVRNYCGPYGYARGRIDLTFYTWQPDCKWAMVWPEVGATTGTIEVQ